MSIKVANSRFIHSSFKRWVGLYQQIMDISDLDKLGKWLVAECERAQAIRETGKLKEMSLMLSGIPIQEYQLIGQFYQAYTGMSQNQYKVFESVVEKSRTYKSIALIALATLELQAGNCDSGIQFCNEAIRYTRNASIMMYAARSISVIKSVEGFHITALKDLEKIAPLARYVSPVAGYQYYNSCAVELCEVGRLEEARNISNIVLASPYINAYPEWRETSDDIERKGRRSSRSFVPIIQGAIQHNVLLLPLSDSEKTYARSPFQPPATVRSIVEWKKMPKKKNGDKKDDYALPANPTERDVFFRIMHLASRDGLSEKKLWKMLEAVERISEEPEE